MSEFENLNVQIVMRSENPPVVPGIEWNVRKGHCFSQEISVDVPNAIEIINKANPGFILPEGVEFRLITRESGGGATNTGLAFVIAGLNGEAMTPFLVPRGYANSTHAVFAGHSFTIVKAIRDRLVRYVHVIQASIDDKGFIDAKLLWYGEMSKTDHSWKEIIKEIVPSKAMAYLDAIAAACEKSGCYHCREPHFIKTRDGE
jgi:hypothetical protein